MKIIPGVVLVFLLAPVLNSASAAAAFGSSLRLECQWG